MGKIDNNKQMKRESLLDSAFSLFINNGFSKTSISDIVNNAGVAKGTFYLYFKDKYDIRNHLIAHKASQVFQAAYTDLLRHPDIRDFEEQVLFITDNILDQFAANHSLVTLISKHLSWGFFKNSLTFAPFADTPAIYTIYESLLSHAAYTYRSPELMFYMILELVGGGTHPYSGGRRYLRGCDPRAVSENRRDRLPHVRKNRTGEPDAVPERKCEHGTSILKRIHPLPHRCQSRAQRESGTGRTLTSLDKKSPVSEAVG